LRFVLHNGLFKLSIVGELSDEAGQTSEKKSEFYRLACTISEQSWHEKPAKSSNAINLQANNTESNIYSHYCL